MARSILRMYILNGIEQEKTEKSFSCFFLLQVLSVKNQPTSAHTQISQRLNLKKYPCEGKFD